MIAIDNGAVLAGELPSRALKLISEWVTLHHAELETTGAERRTAARLSRSIRCHKMERWTS